jgi:hypothetical protein|tara:strand:- start:33 stop:893 length:861 start_codon:yes stop_codon:yes gene_type:complete
MYYPKSQIKTNLFTNGDEYVYYNTNNEYSGSYFITGNGKVFTGKNPNNKPNDPLSAISENLNGFQQLSSEQEDLPISYNVINDSYYWAKGISTTINNPVPSPPIQILPSPTTKEYEIGEIQRYFTSKINEIKYVEINEAQFTSFKNNESNVQSSLYSTFQLPWVITGNRSRAYNVNMKTINRVITNFKLQGFKSYFKGRYDQLFKYTPQENLYTEGGEFKSISNGKTYKGYYHLHPEKGPMEGRQHTIESHSVLLPISGSNTQQFQDIKEPISNNYNSSSRAVGYR